MIYDESAYLYTLKRGKFTKGKEKNLGGAYSEQKTWNIPAEN